jgi:hypothetical protein
MTAKRHTVGPPNPVQDTANLRLVRPPLVYVASLIVGVLAQLLIPLTFLLHTLATPVGAALIVRSTFVAAEKSNGLIKLLLKRDEDVFTVMLDYHSGLRYRI